MSFGIKKKKKKVFTKRRHAHIYWVTLSGLFVPYICLTRIGVEHCNCTFCAVGLLILFENPRMASLKQNKKGVDQGFLSAGCDKGAVDQ